MFHHAAHKNLSAPAGQVVHANPFAHSRNWFNPDSPDFLVGDHGSIITITPVSEEGKAWIDENVESESWQWLGSSLCVDHGLAGPLLAGISEAGLTAEA